MPNDSQVRPFFSGLVWITLVLLLLFVATNEFPNWKERVEQWWNAPTHINGKLSEPIKVAIQTAIASSPRPEWFNAEAISVLELNEDAIIVGLVMSEPDYRWDEKTQEAIKNEAKQESDSKVVNVLCRRFQRTNDTLDETGKKKLKAGSTYWVAQIIQTKSSYISLP